jgi:hypothetical protein
MQKSLVIVLLGSLLLLCVGAQMFSVQRLNPNISNNHYYYIQ